MTIQEAIAWAKREIEAIKRDDFYRPEMTEHLETLIKAAAPEQTGIYPGA